MAKHGHKWIVMTGASRGIGGALAESLRRKGFSVCGLVRQAQVDRVESRLDHVIPWDLACAWEKNSSPAWESFVKNHEIVGFIHAAGQLGPMHTRPTDTSSEDWSSWWKSYTEALRVNHTAGLELAIALVPHLQGWSGDRGVRQPFLCHLSSGAAVKPYVGWEVYCASKAAMLMAFQCLAVQHPIHRLNVLSVAPGTVMTDMMQQVLAANPSDFPALSKFKELERRGELLPPNVPAQKMTDWLIDSSSEEICRWHGDLYDVRSSNPTTRS